MFFNSFPFWIVFSVIFLLYWGISARFASVRKACLILASYLLYMNWKPAFALVLLYVTGVTFLGALALEVRISKKNTLCWVFTLMAIVPLLVFKYYNFLNENIVMLLQRIGLRVELRGLNYAIPVGLSFFTFQAIGYLLDVYRGEIKAERNWFDYMLFVSFFPQIASGPISKGSELLPQIKRLPAFDYTTGKQGLKFVLWGMFIKVVIADRLGMFVDVIFDHFTEYNGTTCFLASLFYSFQIYCDFSGYSLMAIGVARLLGFKLIDNFKRPYLATSITEFWRRWHISLTRWLTQNIYIPLGGSRCSKTRCYLNIMVTFLVSGIWHGAAWTFIFWGILHGLLQVVEKSLNLAHYHGTSVWVRVGRIVVTFFVVDIAWVFFRMPTISGAFSMLKGFFTNPGFPDCSSFGSTNLMIVALSMAIFLFKELREEFFPNGCVFLNRKAVRWGCYLILFCMIMTVGVLDGGQFIYVGF